MEPQSQRTLDPINEEEDSEENIEEENEEEEEIDNELTKPNLLVIEDEEENILPIFRELGSMGIQCHSAKSVCEAIQKVQEMKKKCLTIDVIYLDFYLENDSKAPQFLKEVKDEDWLKNTITFVMSASKEEKIQEECYKYRNVSDFIQKPINKTEFKVQKTKIKEFLDKKRCPIKGYKIISSLGAGNQATVYKVINLKDGKYYAMKEKSLEKNILTDKAIAAASQNNKNSKKKNIRDISESTEANCLRNCRAPTIIRLYITKYFNNKEYMIIEYAEKGSLSDKIEQYRKTNQKFTTKQIIDWMVQIFIGLYVIHKKGTMHRDIKSQNLLLCNNDIIKIADLGTARNISNCATNVGALNYKAPEMIAFQVYNKKVDVWAAGVVLYELIMLKLPFDESDSEKTRQKILKKEYGEVPESTNHNLKLLLKLTLAMKEERATSTQILGLKFIKDRVEYFYKNKIIDIDKNLYKEIMSLKNEEKNLFEKEDTKTLIKEHDYFKCFQNMQKIYYRFPRTSIYSNFYLNLVQVLSEYSLFNPEEELKISPEEIEDLKEIGILIPYETQNNNKNNKNIIPKNKFCSQNNSRFKKNNKIDEKKYYCIIKNKIPGIDNTLNVPINDNDFFDCFYLDPLETSNEALQKTITAFVQCRKLLEDEEMGDDDKYYFACSKESYEFLLACKKLQNIDLSKCSSNEKMSIMLNIYQAMLYHYIMKCVMYDYELNEKINLSFFQSVLASLKMGKFKITFKYKIAGEIFSLHDLKHIVFRRNKPEPYWIFPPTYRNDPRINFIDDKSISESMKDKLTILAICQDPPDILDNDTPDIQEPVGICFKPSTLAKDLERSMLYFVKDNIWVDDNFIHVPKFIYYYLRDLGNDENKVIKFLLSQYYHETYFKNKYNMTVNKLLSNKIKVNYYEISNRYS